MAPLSPANTARYWLIYENNGTTHRLMARCSPSFAVATASSTFSNLFTNLGPTLRATTILGMEFAAVGTNVRNPVTYSGTTTFGLGTEEDADTRARCISFVGRTVDGRRSRLFVFGTSGFSEGDYRVDGTESAAIQAAINHINGAVGFYLSISGLEPVYKNYANVGYNDHWIKEYRKG